MAHKKAGGSSRNGRDSAGKRLGVMGEGDFFGEMALIDFSPRAADAISNNDLTVSVIIPARNEAHQIAALRRYLGRHQVGVSISIYISGTSNYKTEHGIILCGTVNFQGRYW